MIHAILRTLIYDTSAVILFMVIAFGIGQRIKRYDVADIAWGLVFIVIAVTSYIVGGTSSERPLILTILVTLWGLRLAGHIFIRFRKKDVEDRRYVEMREKFAKHPVLLPFIRIFMSQGLLALVVTLPVIIASTTSNFSFGWEGYVGGGVWIIGFVFETLGDSQLMTFLGDKKNKGKLMGYGLWKYSRHPNYFGELTQWWGIGIIASVTPYGLYGFIGPFILSVLILKVSGIPLLEKHYAGRTDWEEYKARTSMILPWPQKKAEPVPVPEV